MKTIYELELHEQVAVGHFTVTRVPGGWIYYHHYVTANCFVPFNNEFQAIPVPINPETKTEER